MYLGNLENGSRDSWLVKVTETDQESLYIDSAYFVVTTASTVGYGDIVPINNLEMLVCMAMMFLGTIVVALAQS
jgi:hypothetical protein